MNLIMKFKIELKDKNKFTEHKKDYEICKYYNEKHNVFFIMCNALIFSLCFV